MCGRIIQTDFRKGYARKIGWDVSYEPAWVGGDPIPQYNKCPGAPIRFLDMRGSRPNVLSNRWGYRTPREAKENKKPWINARIEKALTGRYFRHMFRAGRVIVPSEGWYEWTVEGGKKQPWFITRVADEPIFMAALTNFVQWEHNMPHQKVETGVVIVTADAEGGMVDVHDRRPVVLEPEDARLWMNPETPVEEAAHIAQTRSLPTEAFMWWKVDRAVNRYDQYNNGKHLLAPTQ
jgi:putative SOS response-associated peptidase YedK